MEMTTMAYSRLGIIFANAIKPTPDSLVGLHFHARNGAVYISHIADDSLFRGCNFRVGDRIVAVNNISCIGAKNATPVVKLLRKTSLPEELQDPTLLAARTVSICVHNEQGDPRTVSTSIQKPDRFTRVAVFLVNRHGSLKVTRIDPDSLFSNSLLLTRHHCHHSNDTPLSLERARRCQFHSRCSGSSDDQ